MDTDPLQDTVPPRYAIESDEEEDEFNPLSRGRTVREPVSIVITGQEASEQLEKHLVVASGEGGKYWARGTDLGPQKGGVFVNNIQVGLIFTPTWSKGVVIISEVTTALPIWAMNQYAQTILDYFKPAQLSLVDTYPVPVYITPQPLLFYDAPVRFLSTSDEKTLASRYQPFSPPNLVQSTSAAFLSNIYVSLASSTAIPHPLKATLLLLPSPHIPPNRSSELIESSTPLSFTVEHDGDLYGGWSQSMMQGVDQYLFRGEKIDRSWSLKGSGGGTALRGENSGIRRSWRGDVGDGGMYI